MSEEQIREKIHVLSELTLYPRARQFFTGEPRYLSNSQAAGLENTVRNVVSLAEIESFIKKQSEKDSEHKNFYQMLLTEEITFIKKLLRDEKIIPEGLTKNEAKEMENRYGILLLYEYIIHLLSENAYMVRKNMSKGKKKNQ